MKIMSGKENGESLVDNTRVSSFCTLGQERPPGYHAIPIDKRPIMSSLELRHPIGTKIIHIIQMVAKVVSGIIGTKPQGIINRIISF